MGTVLYFSDLHGPPRPGPLHVPPVKNLSFKASKKICQLHAVCLRPLIKCNNYFEKLGIFHCHNYYQEQKNTIKVKPELTTTSES